ncbi:hypothetical protein ES703_31868 [subsurface metagenome]
MPSISLHLRGELLEYTKSVETKTPHKAHNHVPRITVLGIGNLLLRDEGVGVHLVQQLAGNDISYVNLNIIDGGTSPDILSLVDDGIDKLIIVDAVKAGNRAGTIYRFGFADLGFDSEMPISLHDIGVLDSLRMMALLNNQPKSTVIIGIEPKAIDYGLELSPEVEERLPEVIKLVLKEIEETNTAMEVDR